MSWTASALAEVDLRFVIARNVCDVDPSACNDSETAEIATARAGIVTNASASVVPCRSTMQGLLDTGRGPATRGNSLLLLFLAEVRRLPGEV